MRLLSRSIRTIAFSAIASHALGERDINQKAIPEPETLETLLPFLRSGEIPWDGPNPRSKYMARLFGNFSALPIAWLDFDDDAYCIRLLHIHGADPPPPVPPRGILVELRGKKGRGAVTLSEIKQDGVEWQSKAVPADTADALVALLEKLRLFDAPVLDDLQGFGGDPFNLEIRLGTRYNYMGRQVFSLGTASARTREFLSFIRKLVEIAGVPESEVFYGDR